MKYDDTVDFKVNCNSAEYFKLFEPYIPKLKLGSTVLLYAISNVDCLKNIIDKNQDCVYYIYDTTAIFDVLKLINENNNVILVNDISEANMKFDCIIMNPPYQRNLHLKILEKAISMLKDENSVCVNLSPIRWLQDPLAKYKKRSDYNKFEESISKHIEMLNIITSKRSAELFNNGLNIQLGIYKCVKANTFTYDLSNKIIDKIYINFIKDFNVAKHIIFSEPNKFACVVPLICGGSGGRTELCSSNWMVSKEKAFYTNNKNHLGQTYKEYRDKIIWGNVKPKSEVAHIEFNSENERENFYNSWSCNVLRYIYKVSMVDVNVHPEFLPWLGDAINPRTGLKGYEGEWTDEDFYKFFNITLEEQKIIEETMKKYS